MLLRDVFLNAAVVFAVTYDDDLAAHVNLLLLKLFEIFRASVVGIYNLRLNVARG